MASDFERSQLHNCDRFCLQLQSEWATLGYSELIAVALLLTLALRGLNTHLLVVLLQSRQVFTSLRELSLFHALAHIPMHECTLAVHEIELVVDAREPLRDRSGVRDHAHSAHHLCQIAARHHRRRLVVDSTL